VTVMSRGSVKEYAEAIRERYKRAERKEKGRILDEFTQAAGYHRKAAIRLLGSGPRAPGHGRRGRPREYGPEVVKALKLAWEATDHLCAKRLKPFLPELMRVLERQGHLRVTFVVKDQLLKVSASTIDRLLKPYQRMVARRPFSTTKPGGLLKRNIPIRTFADWDEGRPGFMEVDLVAHCGESTEGFYLNTLCAVDIATGWVECRGVGGKGQDRVGSAVHHLSQRLPFPLLGLDSDNGGEFINQHLYAYCQRKKITFTRSRPYKKNDSAHVEQKNWSVVRRLVGYDRYTSKAALEHLNHLYGLVRLFINFFQPTMKLKHKTRHGAKLHKVYDEATTPYQRLLASATITPDKRETLEILYRSLNPVRLLEQINRELHILWAMAEHPNRKEAPVASFLRQLSPLR
jgi:hypothetical protein